MKILCPIWNYSVFLELTFQQNTHVEYTPVTSLDKGSAIEFCIRSDQTEYLDFNQSVLHLKCRILAKDGRELKNKTSDTDATIPDRSIVFPVNYLISSLFKQAEVYLGGRLISSNDNMYPYLAYMEILLSYSKDVKNEFFTAGGYYLESRNLEDAKDVAQEDTSNVNPSAVTRFTKTKF